MYAWSGKLPLYEHGHQVELQALEDVVQTPPDDYEDLLWEVIIQHIKVQQGPHLVEVAFIPTTRLLDFIANEEGKDGG